MVEYFNGGEKLMNYTELFKIFNSINEDGSKMGNFDNINDHSKVKYNIWEVKFLWDKVEEKWEPIQTIKNTTNSPLPPMKEIINSFSRPHGNVQGNSPRISRSSLGCPGYFLPRLSGTISSTSIELSLTGMLKRPSSLIMITVTSS